MQFLNSGHARRRFLKENLRALQKAKGDQLVFRALGISAWQSTQIERYSIECATPLAWISVWQLR